MPVSEKVGSFSEKLGEERGRQVDILSSLEQSLNSILSEDKCDDTMRENVASKMQGLMTLLVDITRVANARHASKDTKADTVGHAIDSFNIKEFSNGLKAEIEDTKKCLLSKTKLTARAVKRNVEQTAQELISAIEDNVRLLEEELKDAKKKESELKRGKDIESIGDIDPEHLFDVPGDDKKAEAPKTSHKKSRGKSRLKAPGKEQAKRRLKKRIEKLDERYADMEDRKQQALVEYKSHGFVDTFKRLWSERKASDKKQSIFSVIKNTLLRRMEKLA